MAMPLDLYVANTGPLLSDKARSNLQMGRKLHLCHRIAALGGGCDRKK